MTQLDLHNNLKFVRVISPVAVGTTGTGQTGKIVDRSIGGGFQGIEFLLAYGTVTATNATVIPTILEGDVTGTMTSVADSNMIPNAGAELAASIAAAATRTSGTSKNVQHKIGYIGTKRYVTAKVISTVTAGPPVAVYAVLGNANIRPVAS